MVRLRAALIHLGISSLIAAVLLLVVFKFWYPAPLSTMLGLGSILLLLLCVDISIGPTITLIIFTPRKSRRALQLDLTVIAICQMAALIYGIHTVYVARPVAIVFNKDRFDVVTAIDIDQTSLRRAAKISPQVFASLPVLGPQWYVALPPADPAKRQEILFGALNGGHDLHQMPEYYHPYAAMQPEIIAHIHSLDELKKLNPMSEQEWQEKIGYDAQSQKDIAYLPVRAQSRDGIVLVKKQSGERLGIVLLQPWPATVQTNPALR